MKIKHKFMCVDGDFDTHTGKLSCVGNKKYGSVTLCFNEGLHITFASIKLHSKNHKVDADAVFEDALRLGKEIARRWNEYDDKKGE